jgi:starch-binding outer membrane protein, SusD/RagB family
MKSLMHSRFASVLLFVLSLGNAACKDLQIPNYNAQSITDLAQGATPAAVGTAATGLLVASRNFNTSSLASYLVLASEFGREGYDLDPSNGQHPIDRLDQIGTAEASYAGWGRAYTMIRQANIIIRALETAVGLTDQEKEAVRGFTKTMHALALHRVNNVFDNAGAPIDVDIPTSADAAPIVPNAQVKARIVQLLDEAKTHLAAGGTRFHFKLSPGFTGFDTPATFLKFNRALRARMAVYQQDWPTALTALSESFLDVGQPLTLGAYDAYSSNSGDLPNPLFDPTCRVLFSIPENETEAQLQTDGVTRDRRYVQKVQRIPGLGPAPAVRVIHGISVAHCFTMYGSASTSIPIIRNEELILLRAEARYNSADPGGALTDINFVRQNSGGLNPVGAFADATAFADELLYNRRYSLLWEGGHRWIDMRRYGRLAALPRALARHKIFPHLPLPLSECTPRQPAPAGCTYPAGI